MEITGTVPIDLNGTLPPAPGRSRATFLALMFVISITPCLFATTHYWTNTTGTTAYWTNPDNWQSGSVPNGIGSVADLRCDLVVTQTIILDTPITVGSLLMGDTASSWMNQTLSGSGSLTFQHGSGLALLCPLSPNATPQTYVGCSMILGSDLLVSNDMVNRGVWLTGAISESGRHSVRHLGPGNVALYGANTYTGGTTIDQAFVTLVQSDLSTPGNPAWGPFGSGDAPLIISGASLRGRPGQGITITNANRIQLAGDVTFPSETGGTNLVFTGPLTLSNGDRVMTVDYGTTISQAIVFVGPIDDGGANLAVTFQGSGITRLVATNTWGGNTFLRSGTLRLGSPNILPVGSGKGNLIFSPGPGSNAILDLWGNDHAINGLSNEGSGVAMIQNNGAAYKTLTFGSNDAPSFFSGTITNSPSILSLQKIGGGPAIFSNARLNCGGHFQIYSSPTGPVTFTGNTTLTLASMSVGKTPFANNDVSFSGTIAAVIQNLYLGNTLQCPARVFQSGGSITVWDQFRIGHFDSETSLWDMSGGSLSLTGNTASNPFTAGASEQSGAMYLGVTGTGLFRQTGGTVSVQALVLDNRTLSTGVDSYELLGGTLQILTNWGISGHCDGNFTLGNGVLLTPTDWTNAAPLVFAFTGTNTLTGVHTNPSALVLSNGTLVFRGRFPGTNLFTVTQGATLAGTGSNHGSLLVSGTVQPGVPGTQVGSLTFSNASFLSGSRFRVDLAGPSNGSLVATGSVALGGTLEISSTNAMVTGQTWDVVVASNLTGTFSGLPNGATFVDRGRQFLMTLLPDRARLTDLGPVQTVMSVTNPIAFSLVTAAMVFSGLASNLDTNMGLPQVYVATNGGPLALLTQGSSWSWSPPWASLPDGTNRFSFYAVSSNGSTNRVDRDHVIDHQSPGPVAFSPGATNFTGRITVTLSATDAGGIQSIWVSTDGSLPGPMSTVVPNGGSIILESTTTLRAAAMDLSSNWGVATSATYVRNPSEPGTGAIQSVVPNPYRPGQGILVMSLTRKTLETVELVVFDMQGRTVCSLKSSLPDQDYACRFEWDGKGPGGQSVGRGLYRIVPKVGGVLLGDLGGKLYLL